MPPGPTSLEFLTHPEVQDEEGEFHFYLQEKLLFQVETVLSLEQALNFLYSKLALRFGLQDSSKFLVLQSWKKNVYFLRIDTLQINQTSTISTSENSDTPMNPTLSVSFYGLVPPSSDFLGDFHSYIASQLSHLTMLKVATKLQEDPSNHSLLQIILGGLNRSLTLQSPPFPVQFDCTLLQKFLLQNLSRFFQISDIERLEPPNDEGSPFLLYNYNLLRYNRELHKVLLPGVALIRFKFNSYCISERPSPSEFHHILKWNSNDSDDPHPFKFEVYSLGNLHWENLQMLLQKAFTQASLELCYEKIASTTEQRSYYFSQLLQWGAPSSLMSPAYHLPTPSLLITLNLLCATLLILHQFPSDKGVPPSLSYFIPCKLVLTVFQGTKSSDFVFEQVQRFDLLYERLSEILEFERVAALGKNYRLSVSFGDYLPEREGYPSSEKFPRRENYDVSNSQSHALNLLKLYLPFREGEQETPRKFELRVLLDNNTLLMQAYNIQDQVLKKVEERAGAIVNWARLKAYQRRSIALHNLGLPLLSSVFKSEIKSIGPQRFISQEKLGQQFSVLRFADTRAALPKEQIGDTSRLIMPLLQTRETSNRSGAESPHREHRNPPKLGRGVLDMKRFYRERKQMERQREEEEKRKKQEEILSTMPKEVNHSIEELKTFAFLPSAYKSLEDLNFQKLAQMVRNDSPGQYFLPRKIGWVEASNELLLVEFARYFELTQNYGRRKSNERIDLERVGALLRLAKFSFHKQYQAEERKLGRLLTGIPFHQGSKNSDLAHYLKSRSRLIANLLVPFFLRPPRVIDNVSFGEAAADLQASHRLEEFWIAEYSKFLYKRISPKSLSFVERQRGVRSRRPSFAPESFIKVDSVEDNLIHQIESAAGIDTQFQVPEVARIPRVSTAAEMKIRVSGTDLVSSGGSAQQLSNKRKLGERLLPLQDQPSGRMLQREFLRVFENTIFLIELVYDGHFQIRVYQTDSLVLTLLPSRLLFDHQLPLCLTSPVSPETRPFLSLLKEGFRFDSFNYDLVLDKAARSLQSTHLEVDMAWMLGSCLNFYRQAPRYARNLLYFKAVDLALSSALPFVEPEAVVFFRTECITRFGYSLHTPSGFLFKTLLGRDSTTPEVAFLLADSSTSISTEKLHRSVFRPPPIRLLETEEQEQLDPMEEFKEPHRAASPASPFLGLAHHSHGEGGILYDEGDTFAPRFYAQSSSGGPSFPGSRKVSQEEKPLIAEKVILMFKVLQEGESDVAEEFQLQSEIERIGGEGRALRLRYFLLFLNEATPEKPQTAKQMNETPNSQRYPAERIAEMAIYVEQILTSTFGALKDSFERAKVWGSYARFPKLNFTAYQEISFVSNVRNLSLFDPFYSRLTQLRPSVEFWRYMRVRFRGRCSEFTSEPRSSYVKPHFYNTETNSVESMSSIQTAPQFTVLFPGELHVLGVAFFAPDQSDFFVVLETLETNRKLLEGRLVRKIGVAQDVPLTPEQSGLLDEVRNALLYYLWLKSSTSSGEKFLESLKRHAKQSE